MARSAVIMAGGKGTRLAERLNGRPKPLVDIDGVPLLERQLKALKSGGVTRAIILVNHEADQIRDFCAQSDGFGLDIAIIDDGSPRGTAGALLAVLDALPERFLVVYGDTLFDVDFDALWTAHEAAGADATLFAHPNDHPHDSDIIEANADGRVRAFHAYPHPEGRYLPNLVNAALYVIERTALEPWRAFRQPSDLAKHLFPAMLEAGADLRAYRSAEYIKDIGTPARLDKAVGHLRSGVVARAKRTEPQRVVFLDRDGTLNHLTTADYVRSPSDLELLPGAAAAVKALNAAEYRAVLVTNQPVLARGEASFEDLAQIHAKLETELGRGGAYLDAIHFCPHHPHKGFPGEVAALKMDCACRKPSTGMIEAAEREFAIDRARSWMIGDTTMDLELARRAGLRSVLVETGEAGKDGKYDAVPDLRAGTILEAVEAIVSLDGADRSP